TNMHRFVEEISKRRSYRAIFELAAGRDGGRAANHGVGHQLALKADILDEGPSERGDSRGERPGTALTTHRHGRGTSHKCVASEVGDVATGEGLDPSGGVCEISNPEKGCCRQACAAASL